MLLHHLIPHGESATPPIPPACLLPHLQTTRRLPHSLFHHRPPLFAAAMPPRGSSPVIQHLCKQNLIGISQLIYSSHMSKQREPAGLDNGGKWRWLSHLIYCIIHIMHINHMHHHHHTTTVLWPFFRDHLGEPVPEDNFWTLWCKERLTEADTPTIQLGATPSGLTSAHLHHPPYFFTGRMPFLPPN